MKLSALLPSLELIAERPLRSLVLAAAVIAAVPQAQASLLRNYDLNGSLADSLGGNALTANGGVLGATGYTFGANQGLTLTGTGLANLGEYSIEMRVKLDSLRAFSGSRWIKLIDFKNLTSDDGLYSFDTDGNPNGTIVQFYPIGGTLDSFTPNQFANVVITRDGTTKQVVTYVEGFGQFSFTDFSDRAVFSNNIIHFMRDDAATGFGEAGSGSLDYIRIYGNALTATEVSNLNPVPDAASTLGLIGLALAAIAGARRRFAVRG